MRSKLIIALVSLTSLVTGASAQAINPLGLIIRPSFVQNMVERLNKQTQPLKRHLETDLFAADLEFKTQWSVEWKEDSGALTLLAELHNLSITGDLFVRSRDQQWVEIHPRARSLMGVIETLPLKIVIFPDSLEVFLSINYDSKTILNQLEPDPENKRPLAETQRLFRSLVLEKMGAAMSGFTEINSILGMPDAKERVLQAILREGSNSLSTLFQETVQGLGYGEYLSSATPTSPLWKAGPLFQSESLTLDLAEPTPSQKEIAFAFHRFDRNSIVATNDQLELYVNAIFLTHDLLGSLTGLNTTFTSPEKLLERAMDNLKNNPAQFSRDWQRPQISKSSSDLSVVIPKSLINLALTTVYKEGLLRFRAKQDIGRTTKGLLTSENIQSDLVVSINPNQAPTIDFDADSLQLDVSNYSLDIGSAIEDRIIPLTSLQTRTNISAELAIDNAAQFLNLKLSPSTFQIDLDDPRHRITDREKAVFKEVSEKLWKDFLTSYSDLNLFRTVINTKRAPIKMVHARVAGQNILLDLDIDWEKADL